MRSDSTREARDAIRALDDFLNDQLLGAATRDEERCLWGLKLEAKRALGMLPEDLVQSAAAQILLALQAQGPRAA